MADYGKQYDHEPDNGILPQAFPGEQIDACTYRIRPADKSEDAPPAYLERFPVHVLVDDEEGKQKHACCFHCGEKDLFRSYRFGIYPPGEEETDDHQDGEPWVREAAFDASAVQ